MRHSDIRLTMQVHTDPKLFDLQGAVASLPSVAPSVAPTPVIAGAMESSPGNPPSDTDSPQVLDLPGNRRVS